MLPSKKFTTRLLPTFLALIALLLAACGGGGGTNQATPTAATKAPASQQVYRWSVANPDIPTFDPGQASDALSIDAILLVFSGMVQLDDQLKVAPELASSWDVSSDGLTYTFHLRPGLKFSDGAPLTSHDVVFSIDRALSPQISSLSGVSLTYLGLIKHATERTQKKVASLINDSLLTPDDNTVVIKVIKQTAYFLQAFTYPTSFVVEKSVIDKWGLKYTDHLSDNGGQGGSGPFKVKLYDHTVGIKFIPNSNYWGSKPQLQEIDQNFYKDPKTAYEAYLANQVDITPIPSANYEQAKNRPDFSRTPELVIFYLALNYLAKPFDNIHIRQAFDLAINKDVLIKGVWKNRFIPTNHIVPQGMYGYNASLKGPDGTTSTAGNAAMAKKLFQQGLQEEGWTSVSQMPALKISYPSGSVDTANEITTIIGMWKTVLGVTVGTQTLEFGPLLTAESATTGKSPAQGGLQMWSAGWGADYPDPQDWLTLQFGDNQPYNEFNYGNNNGPDAAAQRANQQAMDAADAMTDPNARAAAYNKAEQQLVNEVAWLPLYQRPGLRLRKTYVVGIHDNAIAEIPPQDWANVYIASH